MKQHLYACAFFFAMIAVAVAQNPFAPHPLPTPTPTHAPAPAPAPAPKPAVFVPAFRKDCVVSSPWGQTASLNPFYFATPATADYLVRRFHLMGSIAVPPFGAGSMYTVNCLQLEVLIPGGIAYDAGLLAEYFVQYPEDKLPGMAESQINLAIANLQARAAAK